MKCTALGETERIASAAISERQAHANRRRTPILVVCRL